MQSLLNKLLIIFILLLSISFNLKAQTKLFDWDEPDFSVPEIPKELLNEDAIILNQMDILSIEPMKNYFFRENQEAMKDYDLITFKKVRLKILTINGLEKHANPEFLLKAGAGIEILDGRILKTNKKVYYIDSSDAVQINLRNFSSGLFNEDIYTQKIKVAFPNVEVGDIIEYVYSYKTPGFLPFDLSKEVLLNSDLPILKAYYYIKVPNDMDIFYKLYNQFADPITTNSNADIICEFQQVNVPSLKNSEFSNLQSQMPFFYYQVLPSEIKNFRMDWDFIYKIFDAISFSEKVQNPLNKNYYKKWKNNLLKDFKDSSKTEKFKILYSDIRDHLIVKDVLPGFETMYTPGYYLKAGYINRNNLLRLYKKIFEDLEMNYYICFARDRYKDPINYEDIRKEEATDIFFIYTDENKKYHIVYPNDGIQPYEIDETPNHLAGTDAIMMQHKIDKSKPFSLAIPELAEYVKNVYKLKYDYKIEKNVFSISPGNTNKNYINQQNFVTIRLDDSLNYFKENIKLSGALSTKYRTFFSLMDKNKDLSQYYSTISDELFRNLKYDTSYIESFKHNYPCEFKLVTTGEIKNCIQKIDSNIYILSLKDLIHHDILDLPYEERIYNITPEFIYSDIAQLFIKFDKPINQINSPAFNVKIDNEFGTYTLISKKINENTIMVNSQYIVKTNNLPAEKFSMLSELTKAYKKALLTRLVVQSL